LEHKNSSLFDFVRHKIFKKIDYDVQLVNGRLAFDNFSTEGFLRETNFDVLLDHFDDMLVPPKDVEFKEVASGNQRKRYITLNTSQAISLFCNFAVVPKRRAAEGHGCVKIDASSNVVAVVPPLQLVHTEVVKEEPGDFSSQRLACYLNIAGYSFVDLTAGPQLSRPAKYDRQFPGSI
jgi:hypothetical protein